MSNIYKQTIFKPKNKKQYNNIKLVSNQTSSIEDHENNTFPEHILNHLNRAPSRRVLYAMVRDLQMDQV